MSEFKKGDYVEVINACSHDIENNIKEGMRGYVLNDFATKPFVNFVNNELDFDKCKKLKKENNNELYCWTMFDFQLKLVEEQEEGK